MRWPSGGHWGTPEQFVIVNGIRMTWPEARQMNGFLLT